MRRFKLLPSILMLILCTAVLAVGIYAASPTSHSIVGTVKITAGGANVSITGYLDDGDGVYSNDVKVTGTYTSRTSQTISIYANALDFDCSSASDIAEAAEKKLYFKVENHSGFSLGAYFLEGTVPEGGTTMSNIAESKNFDGTMGTTTITNLITATFTPYSEVPVGDSAYMYSTLKLNQLNSEASTVTLNLNLNIEKCNTTLLPKENSIKVSGGGTSVSVDCLLQNASKPSTMQISTSGVWEIGELSFSDELFLGHLRLQTIKAGMTITNNDTSPIRATITEGTKNTAQDSSLVEVTIINIPYIAPGKTGEVSVQFSAVYDRKTGDNLTQVTAPEIKTYNFNVKIEKINQVETLLSRVIYDSDTTAGSMPTRGFNYYVEFGDNPYYTEGSTTQRPKLRWYIWGKDDGTGNPEALVPGTDYDATTKAFIGGGTYYFISEFAIDDIPYQNEHNVCNENYPVGNPMGYNGANYATSNIRNYLNGLTVKNNCSEEWISRIEDEINYLANGDNVNFLTKFNFINDTLFNRITERSVQELYTIDNQTGTIPTGYENEKDRFWLLSESEFNFLKNTYPNCDESWIQHIAYDYEYTTWWIFRINDGLWTRNSVDGPEDVDGQSPQRPAFKLTI